MNAMLLKKYWTLDEALVLIRAIQPDAKKFQYHVTLGGGVLNRGESQKDLDLYFLPMGMGKGKDPGGLVKYLEGLWGKGQNLFEHPEKRAEPQRPGDVEVIPWFHYAHWEQPQGTQVFRWQQDPVAVDLETDPQLTVTAPVPGEVMRYVPATPMPGTTLVEHLWNEIHTPSPILELQQDPDYPEGIGDQYQKAMKFNYSDLRIDVFVL